MNTLAIIFSYNRDKPLLKTLKELHGHYSILTIDDGSEYDYSEHKEYCEYLRLPHVGKRGFWKNWLTAFQWCKLSDYERFIFLPDDWREYDIERINNTFELFGNKFASNIGNVGWDISWTPVRKQLSDLDGYFRCGWCDQGMITTRAVLRYLNYDVHPISEFHFENNVSSGVGKQISTRLYKMNIPMYMPVRSMAKDQDVESVMNTEFRKDNPLQLI